MNINQCSDSHGNSQLFPSRFSVQPGAPDYPFRTSPSSVRCSAVLLVVSERENWTLWGTIKLSLSINDWDTTKKKQSQFYLISTSVLENQPYLSIMTRLGDNPLREQGSISYGGKSYKSVLGPKQSPPQLKLGPLPREKWLKLEAKYTPVLNFRFKFAWSYTSSSPYTFVKSCSQGPLHSTFETP